MITLAIDCYDRHLPFFDGTLDMTGDPEIHVLQVGQTGHLRDGAARHERMLQNGEFDAAETSLASYFAAKSRGLPYTAIPVFPRRLFSQGQIFVNTSAGIESPKDLEGKTVGLQSFQTTLAVLAKGDLSSLYGVSLEKIHWVVVHDDAIQIDYPSDIDIRKAPAGSNLSEMLSRGDIDGLFFSRTPLPQSGKKGVIRRLFSSPETEELRFIQEHGYWPIMHVLALKTETADKHLDLPIRLMALFEAAYRQSSEYYADPNWSRIVWAKYAYDAECAAFADDLWTTGIRANAPNLARFADYALQQGLIDHPMTLAELFHPSTLES